jgi:hypothetical protein
MPKMIAARINIHHRQAFYGHLPPPDEVWSDDDF